MATKPPTTPAPSDPPRHERTWYDRIGRLSVSCAEGRCGGCQHPTCPCEHHRDGQAPTDR
ncbi:hypothetical protein ACQP2T_60910 [Nonomuraea sp. CA-143628]|uniref:hypothetical protein n=1 Tax=Nonomuraea sp. CA-143628 TaxID=3239997 RepID=UPI003D935FFD